MVSKRKLLFGLLVLAAVLALTSVWILRSTKPVVIGSPVQVDQGSYTNITPKDLTTLLQAKDFALINVHIPYEGEIANTDAKIAYNEIDQHLDQLPADKSARIVLYCRSGRMSTLAAQQLVKLGYTHIFNLAGGMIAWEQAGYPLLNR